MIVTALHPPEVQSELRLIASEEASIRRQADLVDAEGLLLLKPTLN